MEGDGAVMEGNVRRGSYRLLEQCTLPFGIGWGSKVRVGVTNVNTRRMTNVNPKSNPSPNPNPNPHPNSEDMRTPSTGGHCGEK